MDYDETLNPDLAEESVRTHRLIALQRFLTEGLKCRMSSHHVPEVIATTYDAAVIEALKAITRIARNS